MDQFHTITVNDMTCAHCTATVTKALTESLPGTEVKIDLRTHRVIFTGDRTIGEEAIRQAGYTPEP